MASHGGLDERFRSVVALVGHTDPDMRAQVGVAVHMERATESLDTLGNGSEPDVAHHERLLESLQLEPTTVVAHLDEHIVE